MATPTAFTADMLKEMAKAVEEYRPRESLLMSAGFRRELVRSTDALKPYAAANPLLAGYTQSYMGIPIEAVDIPPEEILDWSECRSPSRAKRRHARGIPQRVKITYRERAFLIDKRVLTDWSNRFDRMAVKILLGE